MANGPLSGRTDGLFARLEKLKKSSQLYNEVVEVLGQILKVAEDTVIIRSSLGRGLKEGKPLRGDLTSVLQALAHCDWDLPPGKSDFIGASDIVDRLVSRKFDLEDRALENIFPGFAKLKDQAGYGTPSMPMLVEAMHDNTFSAKEKDLIFRLYIRSNWEWGWEDSVRELTSSLPSPYDQAAVRRLDRLRSRKTYNPDD